MVKGLFVWFLESLNLKSAKDRLVLKICNTCSVKPHQQNHLRNEEISYHLLNYWDSTVGHISNIDTAECNLRWKEPFSRDPARIVSWKENEGKWKDGVIAITCCP